MTDLRTPRTSPLPLRTARPSLRDRASERESPLRRLDWILIAVVLCLCALGSALVWAATDPGLAAAHLSTHSYLKKNLLNIVIGGVLSIVAASVDYRTLRAYTPVLYGLSVLGLIAVMVPGIGVTVNGAHSWISLGGGFEIQPAEFAEIAVILGMAMLLSERRDNQTEPTNRDAVLALALSVIPIILIKLQPDLGSMMVFAVIVFAVLAMSGISLRWVAGMLGVATLGIFAIAQFHLLASYQLARFTSFAHPAATSGTTGYNANQARIAIGDGGIFGHGLFHGPQVNGQFIPYDWTDFVFSVSGEELGLIGSAVLVVLLGMVMWRGLRVARRAQDSFGMLVAVGVVCWFGFQIFENVGMNLGIMPVTGLPLPFVSYGGSSMFASMIAIGLLQNVHIRSQT